MHIGVNSCIPLQYPSSYKHLLLKIKYSNSTNAKYYPEYVYSNMKKYIDEVVSAGIIRMIVCDIGLASIHQLGKYPQKNSVLYTFGLRISISEDEMIGVNILIIKILPLYITQVSTHIDLYKI